MKPHELVEQWFDRVTKSAESAVKTDNVFDVTPWIFEARATWKCHKELKAALEEQKPDADLNRAAVANLSESVGALEAQVQALKQQLAEAREAQRELLTVMADCRDAFTARSPEESKAMKYLDEAVMKYAPKP